MIYEEEFGERKAMASRESSNSEAEVKAALDEAATRLGAYAAPGEKRERDSPLWDEVDAILKGKSDIDLAERIWRLERELAAERERADMNYDHCKRADEERDAARSATRQRFDLTPQQVAQIRDFSFGGENDDPEEAMPVTIGYLPEHEDGPGWYVWGQEYPEEGSLPLVTYAAADKTASDKGKNG